MFTNTRWVVCSTPSDYFLNWIGWSNEFMEAVLDVAAVFELGANQWPPSDLPYNRQLSKKYRFTHDLVFTHSQPKPRTFPTSSRPRHVLQTIGTKQTNFEEETNENPLQLLARLVCYFTRRCVSVSSSRLKLDFRIITIILAYVSRDSSLEDLVLKSIAGPFSSHLTLYQATAGISH